MSDCVIIGGGIIGLLTARELSLAGASVTLLEKGETAQESSWAGGGILSPLYPWRFPDAVTRLARYSQEHYPGLLDQLHQDTGIDSEYIQSGLLIFGDDELDQGIAWARHWNMEAEKVDATLAKGLEPELEIPGHHAVWLSEVGQVRNPRLTKALRFDLEKRGVSVRTHTPVTDIRFQKSGMAEVHTPEGSLTADRILVSAGAWTAQLLDSTTTAPDIAPVRGQMILFHGTPDSIHHITLTEGRYAIPRRDGRILFGSTLEHTGFEKTTTADARDELYDEAVALLPILRRFPIENHWAGLRPSSPQGIPYIGSHPQADNLFVNAGHFRNGVVLGLASARLAADLMLGRDPIVDPKPYALTAER